MCKADPPGWRTEWTGYYPDHKNLKPTWYAGGSGYGKPCVPVPALHDGQPALSCLFCGKSL